MRILAIETSCDETAIAVLKAKKTKTGVAFEKLEMLRKLTGKLA